jgi:PAS domain S-box-containing protein
VPRDAETDPELYRELVEQVPAVVYVVTPDDPPRTLYISPRAEEIYGVPPEVWFTDPTTGLRNVHPDDVERIHRQWREAIAAGEPFSSEYRYIHPDGRIRWFMDRATPVLDQDGTTRLVHGFVEDVTASRHAEQELRGSEARYRALVENIPAVIYEMGPDDERRTIYVSPHVEDVLGYSRAEWLDQPDIWTELLHPDDREIELAAHDLHNETGEPWLRLYRLIADDGRIVWVRDQAVLVQASDAEPPRWQGVMLDITAQKEAEDQLRDARDQLEFRVAERTTALADANELMGLEVAERRRAEAEASQAVAHLRLLVEHVPAVVYTWDLGPYADERVDYTSPQIEAMLGFTPAEWNDQGLWTKRLHPHDRERVVAASKKTETTGQPLNIENRYLHRDGHVVWVLDQAALLRRDPDGRPRVFQGVMLDITARKEAEAKALDAEARFRILAERGPMITYVWEPNVEEGASPYAYISPQIESVLGYPLERWHVSPSLWPAILHPDDRDRAVGDFEAVKRSGEPWSLDYRVLAEDGQIVWLHDEGWTLARDEHGRPSTFQGVILDVTQRKEAEERLRSEESRFRSLVETMPAVPWTEVAEPGGPSRITYIGPQAEQFFGYTAEELLGEPGHFERMVHPEDRERALAIAAESDRTGKPWDAEYRVVRRDGSVMRIRSKAVRTQDEGGRRVWQGVAFQVDTDAPGHDTPSDREVRTPADR